MKRIALTTLALVVFAPALFAQDHGEVGAFAELFRLQSVSPTINFVGVGGRGIFQRIATCATGRRNQLRLQTQLHYYIQQWLYNRLWQQQIAHTAWFVRT